MYIPNKLISVNISVRSSAKLTCKKKKISEDVIFVGGFKMTNLTSIHSNMYKNSSLCIASKLNNGQNSKINSYSTQLTVNHMIRLCHGIEYMRPCPSIDIPHCPISKYEQAQANITSLLQTGYFPEKLSDILNFYSHLFP